MANRFPEATVLHSSPYPTCSDYKETLAFPVSLLLTPLSRFPTTLPQATIETVLSAPLPDGVVRLDSGSVVTEGTRVSIVIVSCDNLAFNRLCLESLLVATSAESYEVIVVDNGSADGTREYLAELARRQKRVRVIFNCENRGFAAANNQALRVAVGDVLVLLNNDTIVVPGWLPRLLRYLDDKTIGLVGPVTNRCGNEAQIEARYSTLGEMVGFAAVRAAEHAGQSFEIRVATMFCVAMRREVFDRIGPLDEQFGLGLFEDDDYSMRVRAAGYRVVCANDVFVHHFGQASLGKLASVGQYGELFHANRRRWEAKWNRLWQPDARRPSADYLNMVARIHELTDRALPPDASVVVVSNGDNKLLDLGGRAACHLPQGAGGAYAGHHPADSVAVIQQLESLREQGKEWLLVPATSSWWLDYYPGLAAYLLKCGSPLVNEPGVCRIFPLRGPR
jgi:GT2 family glycosyltransferase